MTADSNTFIIYPPTELNGGPSEDSETYRLDGPTRVEVAGEIDNGAFLSVLFQEKLEHEVAKYIIFINGKESASIILIPLNAKVLSFNDIDKR